MYFSEFIVLKLGYIGYNKVSIASTIYTGVSISEQGLAIRTRGGVSISVLYG